MLILFQDASGYSRADMTRLMWNAFRAVWIPEPEKEALVAELRDYTVSHGVDWNDVVGVQQEIAAEAAAEAFLSLIDNGNYEESWEEASAMLRSNVDAAQWAEHAGSYRLPLGEVARLR